MKNLRSLIIVPVPEAERVVKDLRTKYDPAALEGVPAHITVLFPFYSPAELRDEKIIKLKEIFINTSSFQFSLSSIDTFPNVVFIKPDPVNDFIELTKKVVSEFPDKPPYEGMHESINPHLTVAQVSKGQDFQSIKNEIELNIVDQLPITAEANEVWIMIEDENGNWTKKEAVPFSLL